MLLAAAIFAGGQSRRMGTDKAALRLGESTLLEQTAQMALDAALPVLIVGRARPHNWLLSTAFAEDSIPGLGPLGGLQTALQTTQSPVLALACDLPLLTTEALRWLRMQPEEWQAGQGSQIGQGKPHGLIVVNEGRWEPLFSVYRPECLPLIEARLAAGRRSLHGLIEAGQFAFVPAPDWLSAQLVNVNTPEDWQAVEQQSKK